MERSPALGERRERLDSEKKVITDCITDISTKSDDNLSNTSSDNSSERIKQLRILIVRRKRTVDDLLKQADGDWTKSKFAGETYELGHFMACRISNSYHYASNNHLIDKYDKLSFDQIYSLVLT